MMKVLIEVQLKKVAGATCDEDEITAAVEEMLDGASLYPVAADADEESEYEVTRVVLAQPAEVDA